MFRKRILAYIIDATLLEMIFMLINIIPFYDDYILLTQDLCKGYYIIYLVCLLLLFIGFIGKDLINGQSVGKRILNIRVVNENGEVPCVFCLFIRNITFFMWPIEFLLLLLDKKRLGERIAKTNVVEQ